MNQEIRNKLRNVVTQCRKLLEESVSQELEGKFGIFAKKDQVTADPNAAMPHLSEEEQAARKDILDHFGHIKARGFKPKDALDQLVREIAFTHLNRLCAYKMMEARDVYVGGQKFREAVSRGINSNGVKFYLADHPEEERLFNRGHQDVAYRRFLDWLGGLLSEEIGVLFSPNDSANRLYPRQKVLDDVLDLLNGGGIKPDETELREEWPKIWSQDETIGWVYQYFTPKELRDQARKESQAPRNSYELAFRNQFFTPRYVVEFLTDNTLGRIWYEMRKGNTTLKDQCRYMVRRSTELFLKDGEQPPKAAAEERDDLSQEELLKQPAHIPHRAKKDPRELKVLDPACGSGHFLLYCFDLLLTIYEEAYTDTDLGPALKQDYETLEDFRRDVPRLILAHNLHGIDIDLRASQIAALALWLRCQRAYQELGLKKDRTTITRSNFVCAEPMPGEEQMLKEFVGQLEPKFLGQVVEVVFDKMKLAGEAGSLLKIEMEIRETVAEARKQWTVGPVAIQRSLFGDEKRTVQQQRFDFSGITDIQFFEQAEAKVIEALSQYAEKAQNGQKLQRRLFAGDAVRGFAFVDLCHKRYDVVLMNPPFGEAAMKSRSYLQDAYPNSKNDLYAAFVERGIGMSAPRGRVGAISSRTGFFLGSLQSWREQIILGQTHPVVFADLGAGVLDSALVETAAYVVETISSQSDLNRDKDSIFIRLLSSQDKDKDLEDSVRLSLDLRGVVYIVKALSFRTVPGSPFSYWVSDKIRKLFERFPPFEAVDRDVKVGLQTGDDFKFVRGWWEVPSHELLDGLMAPPWRNSAQTFRNWCCERTQQKRWFAFAKGGEYMPYHPDLHLVMDWADEGKNIKQAKADDLRNGLITANNSKCWNESHYFRPGLTWPKVTIAGLSMRPLPGGTIFSVGGLAAFPSPDVVEFWLAFTNTRLADLLMRLMGAWHNWEAGMIKRLPFGNPTNAVLDRLRKLVGSAISYAELSQSDELTWGDSHWMFDFQGGSLAEVHAKVEQRRFNNFDCLRSVMAEIENVICDVYGLSSADVEQIASLLDSETRFEWKYDPASQAQVASSSISFLAGCLFGRWDFRQIDDVSRRSKPGDPFAPLPACPPGLLQGANGLPLTQALEGFPIQIAWDGIIVDDADNQADILRRIREVSEHLWGDCAERIEKEFAEILGVKELRDYFRKPGKGGFWDDHISRYSKSRRKAPIYWLLQSSKKNYAIWLYYHRLDKDLLFKALVNYVEPKIRLETGHLETLRNQMAAADASGKEAKRLAKECEQQEDFLSELRDFEDKFRRAANRNLEPDLNDGVVLNIAPLYELVPWKEAKNYWEELLDGKYEWSSIGKQLRQKGLVK
jgi:hypothetical protein